MYLSAAIEQGKGYGAHLEGEMSMLVGNNGPGFLFLFYLKKIK